VQWSPDFTLTHADVIDSAVVPGWGSAFVVGSFDKRITFYSQQVRGLNLAYALHASGGLKNKWRLAVVGAGAAGLSLSAALALLLPDAAVDVFESEQQALNLQRGCTRRHLHPHIYDWPLKGATKAEADLPILDWTADTSDKVAEHVVQQFEGIAVHCKRLVLHTLRKVTAIERDGEDFTVFHEGPNSAGRASGNYHAVFLALGFGHERKLEGLGHRPYSYWSDESVPGEPKAGLDTTRFFVSGSGDGGLVDFAAAALINFDHHDLVRVITTFPGVERIADKLLAIEFLADSHGAGYDFFAAYEREVGDWVREKGLQSIFEQKLRARASLTFNTEGEQLLESATSLLNRFAFFVVMQAAKARGMSVEHRQGRMMRLPEAGAACYRIGGSPVEADIMIIRHGADADRAFRPFDAIRRAYEPAHLCWLAGGESRAKPPQLAESARSRVAQAFQVFQRGSRKGFQRGSTSELSSDNLALDPTAETLPIGLRPSGPILHRDAEVKDLTSRFGEWGRRGGMVTLIGPPRSGKTAVLSKVAAEVAGQKGPPEPVAILHFDLMASPGRPLRALYNTVRTARALPNGMMSDAGAEDPQDETDDIQSASAESITTYLAAQIQGRTLLTFVEGVSSIARRRDFLNELRSIFNAPVFRKSFSLVESQGETIETQLFSDEIHLRPFSPETAADFLIQNGQPADRANAAIELVRDWAEEIFHPGILLQAKFRYPPDGPSAPTERDLANTLTEQASAIVRSVIAGLCESNGSDPDDVLVSLSAMAIFKRAVITPQTLSEAGLARIPQETLQHRGWLEPRSGTRLVGFGLSATEAAAEAILAGNIPGGEKLHSAVLRLGTLLLEQKGLQPPSVLDEAVGWLKRHAPDRGELTAQVQSLLLQQSAADEIPPLTHEEQQEVAPAYLKGAEGGDLDSALAAMALYARDPLNNDAKGAAMASGFLTSARAVSDMIAAGRPLRASQLAALDTILFLGTRRYHAFEKVLSIRREVYATLVRGEQAAVESGDTRWLSAWLSFIVHLADLSQSTADHGSTAAYLESASRIASGAALDQNDSRSQWLLARIAFVRERLAPDTAGQVAALVEGHRHAARCLELAPDDPRCVRFYLRAVQRLLDIEREDEGRKVRVDSARRLLQALFGPSEHWQVSTRAQFAALMTSEARDAWDVKYQSTRAVEALRLLLTSRTAGRREVEGNALASLVEAQLQAFLGHRHQAAAACKRAFDLAPTPTSWLMRLRLLDGYLGGREDWDGNHKEAQDAVEAEAPALREAIKTFRGIVKQRGLTERGYGRVLLWIIQREWRTEGSIDRCVRTQLEDQGRVFARTPIVEKLKLWDHVYNRRKKQLAAIERDFGLSTGLVIVRFRNEAQYRRTVSIATGSEIEVDRVLGVIENGMSLFPNSHILLFKRAEFLRYVWKTNEAIQGFRQVLLSASSGDLRRRAAVSLARTLHMTAVHMNEQDASADEHSREALLREAREIVEPLIGNPDVADEAAILMDHINLELGERVDWTSLQSVYERVVGGLDGFPNSYLEHSESVATIEGAPRSLAEALESRFTDSEVLGVSGLLYLRRAELGFGNDIDEDLRRSLALFRAQAYMERSLRGGELAVTSFRIARAIFVASRRTRSLNPISQLNVEKKKDQLALAAGKFNSAQARATGEFRKVARNYQRLVDAWRASIERPSCEGAGLAANRNAELT
jgi:hypothetical protein